MTYRPTIYLQSKSDLDADDLICSWPHGMPPTFTSVLQDADVALFIANGYEDLFSLLPSLIEAQTTQAPTLLCCDEFGDLRDLIDELNVIKLSYDEKIGTIAGTLYGMTQQLPQLAQLRSKIGFVQTLHKEVQDDLNLLNDELTLAANVQQEFMSTDIEDVQGHSFSSLWRPASVVSGDMYDITQLDEDHVGLFIADAIGHGISAAMLAMMLTRTLAAIRFDPVEGNFTEPSDLLHHLNRALLERTGESARFATAAYGILNCKTNILTFAGAGHPPSLLSKIGAPPLLLESDGPLLGVFEDDTFPQKTIQLEEGDTLLMYSDGFEGVLGNSEHDNKGIPTYLSTMEEFCKSSGKDVLKGISGFLNQTGAIEAEDDLTMICMRTNTIPSSLRFAA